MGKNNKRRAIKSEIPGEETGIQVKTGFCGFCGGDCLLDFYIKDGKIIKTEGNCTLPGANGRVCVKGAAIKQALYNPERILYPMNASENVEKESLNGLAGKKHLIRLQKRCSQ